MKKVLFALAAFVLLAACSGAGESEQKYVTYGGITSKSGDWFQQFDDGDIDSIPLQVTVDGDSADVSMTIKLGRTEEAVKEGAELKAFKINVSGRDEQKDIEADFFANPESVEQLRAILEKPGDSVAVTFKGRMLKANLDSINGKKVWTSLLM